MECGVWRGGHSPLAAGVFALNGVDNDVYLFDTFARMTAPTKEDVIAQDQSSAMPLFLASQAQGHNEWCYAPLDEVRSNFRARDLLNDRVHFVESPVEETLLITDQLSDRISFLRLDTDLYALTVVEMQVLYPRLELGGTFAVDDFGHWVGPRQAVDAFLKDGKIPQTERNYVDYSCRIGQRLA